MQTTKNNKDGLMAWYLDMWLKNKSINVLPDRPVFKMLNW